MRGSIAMSWKMRERERRKQEVRESRSERCLATSGYKFNQTLHTYPHVAQTVSSQARLSGLPHLAPPPPSPPLSAISSHTTCMSPLVCRPWFHFAGLALNNSCRQRRFVSFCAGILYRLNLL